MIESLILLRLPSYHHLRLISDLRYGQSSPRTKTICVVGVGAGGLAALKTILDTQEFKDGLWKPSAFEARERVGGVWLPAEPIDNPPLTPLYDSLTTNLPHPIMAFTGFAFPHSTPVFPKAGVVEEYLANYSSHFGLEPYIRLKTSVKEASYSDSKWHVSLSSGESLDFDSVIVCNGHYRKPRYPSTPGLSDWLVRKKASHSAWYRRPVGMGKKILVVGGGPSGLDISAEMRTCAESVILSVTGSRSYTPQDGGSIRFRGRVTQFNDDSSVVFEDGSTEGGIDHCILATGYEMNFPFISKADMILDLPPSIPPLPKDLFNSTHHVFPLAKHIFPLQSRYPPSSLAFIGLPIRVIPFPLVQAQAAVVMHAYRAPLDVARESEDILALYERLRQSSHTALEIAHAWHVFSGYEQFDYRDALFKFAGGGPVVEDWEKEMYDNKALLRKHWVELEQTGKADKWVHGVGKSGNVQEWVDLLKRLLADARRLIQ